MTGAASQAIDPLRHAGPKLFIIDAHNRVERRLLLDWLHGTFGAIADHEWVCLDLSEESASEQLEQLASALRAPDDCLIIPVRVAWRIPRFDREKTLRLRDILFGDPRMPSSLRARLILLLNRRRAQCLLGQASRIAQLVSGLPQEPARADGAGADRSW